MVHCGSLGVNINRKKGSNTKRELSGIELIKTDWLHVLNYLRKENVQLNYVPME